ncbi:MAG: ArsR/SmtB family transcription factor [Saprospiraceae bacterium]
MSYSRAAEYNTSEQLIALYSKITSHPARLRILTQLASAPLTLYQLCEDHPIPRTTVMRHLNILISHQLVSVESHDFPATYTTQQNLWPPFISHSVRLTHRFKSLSRVSRFGEIQSISG